MYGMFEKHCFYLRKVNDKHYTYFNTLAAPCAFEKYFPRIEAILLFGEPIRWETSLQVKLDIQVGRNIGSEYL